MQYFPECPPSPNGPLSVEVVCHRGGGMNRHAVVLAEDWSVTTPHDLEAERIAAALGGQCSCLDLIDFVIPAARLWLRLNLRQQLLPMQADDRGRWHATDPLRCCRSGSVVEVADHLRSTTHLAAQHQLPEVANLNVLASRLRRAHLPLPRADVGPLVGVVADSVETLLELWKAGLHPAWVASVHVLVGAREPLPAEFYLSVLARRPDLVWIRRTARGGAPELFTWLARTEEDVDRGCRQRRAHWLQLGLSRETVERLNRSRYEPDDVRALATRRQTTVARAAATLTSLVEAGVHPPFPLVWASMGEGTTVTERAVAHVRQILRIRGVVVSAEESACALLRCGSVAIAAHVLQTSRSPAPRDVAEGLKAWRHGQSAAWRRGRGSLGA